MALELEFLQDFKDYCEQFPEVPLFAAVDDHSYVLIGGKVAWKGVVENTTDLDAWLEDRAAMRIKGWRDLETLFER